MKLDANTITEVVDLSAFTKVEVFKACIASAYDLGLPMAMWRSPNQHEINFICSFNKAELLERIDLKELPSGFVFTKFNFSQGKYFIKSDVKISFDYEETLTAGLTSGQGLEFGRLLKEKLSQQTNRPLYFTNDQISFQTNDDYNGLVEKAIDAIKNGHFEKVVPARSKVVSLSEEFDAAELFLALCEGYENAFVSFVSMPHEGTWVGASPEILIATEDNLFTTVSLAGTRKREAYQPISETSWNQKEIEEQAMVSRYIINCFKKIRLREYEERGPKTTVAGNLLHLKTTFKVDMEETNFPELPSVMLDLLHPTSAIAGMPKAPALDFLAEHEGLDRGFYSGYLGPVNMQNKTAIFVNLRCMQLLESQAILYAGAGVTEDSIPEKEYLETEMKCNTLLHKINQKI